MTSFLMFDEAVAVQAIEEVPTGTNARSSAGKPNDGRKSLLLKAKEFDLAIIFICYV